MRYLAQVTFSFKQETSFQENTIVANESLTHFIIYYQIPEVEK